MANPSTINSFVAGELSPRLAGRFDIQQYNQSASEIKNMIVECYGGAKKAPGTYYVATAKDSSKATIVRPFVFSDTQAYIIEIGDYYMRFYKDDGQILAGSSAYELTTTYPASVIKELQFAQKEDILYITHKNYPQSKLTRTAHNSWSINVIDYSTAPARPALMDQNITTTTITSSGTTGTIKLTASTAIFDDDHIGSVWCIGPVTGTHGYAKIIAVSTGGLKTVAMATVCYGGAIPDESAHTDWYEPSWSAYRGFPKSVTIKEQRLIYGYTAYEPQTSWGSVIGSYDNFETGSDSSDALAFKADTNQVETIEWLFPSQEILIGTAGGVSIYGTGSDTTALTPSNGRIRKKANYGVSSIQPKMIGNSVFFFQKYNRILREYSYSLADDNYLSKNATILSEHITDSGIVDMAYQQSPNNILWCVRTDGKLAAFTYESDQKVEAWTLHDTDGSYESVAVIPKSTYDEVWFVVNRTIGGATKRYIEYMVTSEFSEQEDMIYVHSGLTLDSPKTITSIVTTTSPNTILITCNSHGFSNLDKVKIRGVVGMTELNDRKFVVSDAATNTFKIQDADSNYIDGATYTAYSSGGEARKCVSTLTGLDHLEGETVQVLVDGSAQPDCIVVSGAITLAGTYSQVTAGLGYTARITSNDLAQGKITRVIEVIVNLYKTLGCSIGISGSTDAVQFRTSAMHTDQKIDLFTGTKRLSFPSGYAREKKIVIEQAQCLPLHVLSITAEIDKN